MSGTLYVSACHKVTLEQCFRHLRQLNLCQEGDSTHFGQKLEAWNIPRILDHLTKTSGFIKRQNDIEEYNRTNMYRKRGLSLVPCTYGLSFLSKYKNQAGALVHIYKDGSVLLSHGGIF